MAKFLGEAGIITMLSPEYLFAGFVLALSGTRYKAVLAFSRDLPVDAGMCVRMTPTSRYGVDATLRLKGDAHIFSLFACIDYNSYSV